MQNPSKIYEWHAFFVKATEALRFLFFYYFLSHLFNLSLHIVSMVSLPWPGTGMSEIFDITPYANDVVEVRK